MAVDSVVASFNDFVGSRLGFGLREYQVRVASEVVKSIEDGRRFVVVSMPTGSGKTLVEMAAAFYGLRRGFSRILVLEPTRFLCDQMYSGGDRNSRRGVWSRVFGGLVGREYEGNCSSFLEPGKRIVISTPQTALKCASKLKREFMMVVVDEVHHAFGGKYYTELLALLEPEIIAGFTALLPSYKKYRLDQRVREAVGEPYILAYDFKKLERIDPGFKPPRAIADVFDAEMNDYESTAYDTLFRALILGDSRVVKFLEATLARYGKEAFCESYKRALERGRIASSSVLEDLCYSHGLSHKARVLVDILAVYGIGENSGLSLKPVLVFTSRKATAREFKKAISRYAGLPKSRIAVLTSDMSREERLELAKNARRGKTDIIISTLVGEEGIDIPEAGLLVMMDAPKSPLRFYQRLGRLIRMSSRREVKYLVVSLTPKTIEYRDLEDALWNLYIEGVDVSYIVVNIGGKTATSRVLDAVSKFAGIYRDTSIPYTLLAFGEELSNPLNYIYTVIKSRRDLVAAVRETAEKWGLQLDSEEDIDTAIFYILTFHMMRWGKAKNIFKPIDNAINRSRFSRELSKAVREGKLLYIYDVEIVSEIISYKLQKLYQSCTTSKKKICQDWFFRIDRKSILTLFARIFPRSNASYIAKKLKEHLEECKEHLDRAKKSGFLLNYSVHVSSGDYNERAKTLPLKLAIRLDLGSTRTSLNAQINYHDISRELLKDRNTIELIKTNLLAIGYKASKKHLDHLYNSIAPSI